MGVKGISGGYRNSKPQSPREREEVNSSLSARKDHTYTKNQENTYDLENERGKKKIGGKKTLQDFQKH